MDAPCWWLSGVKPGVKLRAGVAQRGEMMRTDCLKFGMCETGRGAQRCGVRGPNWSVGPVRQHTCLSAGGDKYRASSSLSCGVGRVRSPPLGSTLGSDALAATGYMSARWLVSLPAEINGFEVRGARKAKEHWIEDRLPDKARGKRPI